ncbi:MAG: hypothetical protein IPO83_17455 [Chitinophagaceae bacterium]|nr:hypothetical protein [Chitinophagaceae bacterium]
MCKAFFFALVIVCFIIHPVKSQCLGGCCAVANTMEISQSLELPKHKEWMFGVSLITMQYKPLSDEELLNYATSTASVYSVRSHGSFKGMISYGISKRISVCAILPFNRSTENREGHYHVEEGGAEIHSYGSIHGLGDGIVSYNFQFLDNKDKGWKAFAGAGLKIPTGKTDAYSTYAVVLPIHLQPGTGSWDPLLSAVVQKKIGKFSWLSDARVKFATTAKDHNMGTYVNAGIAAGYEMLPLKERKILPLLRCSAGLSGDYNAAMKVMATEEHQHGADSTTLEGSMIADPNTGFMRLFANASVTAFITKRLFIPFTFSLPVAQHVNGYQAKNIFNATIGISFIF